jgi:hypothetical protein
LPTENLKQLAKWLRRPEQQAAIDKAIDTLREFDEGGAADQAKAKGAATKTVKKRVMSEEGRRRIAEASRKRWAATRKAAKKAAKKAA